MDGELTPLEDCMLDCVLFSRKRIDDLVDEDSEDTNVLHECLDDIYARIEDLFVIHPELGEV